MASSHKYSSIPDVEDVKNLVIAPIVQTPSPPEKEKSTYDLCFPFKVLSATVWASFSIWGVWIAVYYGSAISRRDWNAMNIVFPDLYSPEYTTAAIAIAVHFLGAAFMAITGAFQLVKYIRKKYPVFHRWVGRCYIVASLIASIGGLIFILARGSYGGRAADIGFGMYGICFLVSGVCTYVYAFRREFDTHKLWAWRLYSLSLASWMWRFDYYWIMACFGITSWIHDESYHGYFDYFENWAFFVPNLIVVEIIYRWGENTTLSSSWLRAIDICYGIVWILAVVFSCHAAVQLWIPSTTGTYDAEHGWIL